MEISDLFLFNLLKRLHKIEFSRYFIVGTIATLTDWGLFFILAVLLNIYYQFSLVAGLVSGAAVNYALNKLFTFRCKSRAIFRQLSVYSVVFLVSLAFSSMFMFVFVDIITIFKMYARMLTTFIMLVINYTMHKYLTFNKRFFR